MQSGSSVKGNVFISYVREDAQLVDRLQEALEATDITVWRDTKDLWPGQDWKHEIASAIRNDGLAFVACFSEASSARRSSYQFEEILLAVDEYRKMPPFSQWIFPVLFDETRLPDYDLGAGRSLRSIQATKLFGPTRDIQLERLVGTLRALVGPHDDLPPPEDGIAASREILERTAPYYPTHISIADLALELTVSEVDDLDRVTRDTANGLYSSYESYSPGLNAMSMIKERHRMVLLGDPGSGKSTLLAAACAERISSEEGGGVFARLEEIGRIAAGAMPSTQQDAARIVVAAWDRWKRSSSDERAANSVADRILHDSTFLVALDGWDEVSTPAYRDAASEVMELISGAKARLLVSSRVSGYTKPWSDAREYFVNRLSADGPMNFVARWFPEPDSQERNAATQALEIRELRDAARNPLIAGFLCFVASNETVSVSLPGLYRQYVNLFLDRGWKAPVERRRSVSGVALALADAKEIAWVMAAGKRRESAPIWLDTAELDWLLAAGGLRASGLEIYEKDGLLVPYGMPDWEHSLSQEVRWLHRTIHEHLVGRVLSERIQRDFKAGVELLRAAILRPTWQVALEHAIVFLAEFGLAEKCIDQLLDDPNDTPLHRFAEFALIISNRVAPDYRRADLATAARLVASWSSAAEREPDRYLEELRQLAHTTGAPDAGSAERARGAMALPAGSVGFDLAFQLRSKSESWGWATWDELLVREDPQRAFDQFMSEMASGTHFPLGSRFAEITDTQRQRLVAQIKAAVIRHDPRTTMWLDIGARLDQRIVDELKEFAANADSAATVLIESMDATLEDRFTDYSRSAAGDLLAITRGDYGPRASFSLGWHLSEKPDPRLTVDEGWARVGLEFGSTNWEETRPLPSLTREEARAALAPDGLLHRTSTAEGALTWLAALKYMHANPEPDLVALFLDETEDAPHLHDADHPLAVDSVWWQTLVNSVPWRIRFATAERCLRQGLSLSRMSSFWQALLDSLYSACESEPEDLIEYFVRASRLLLDNVVSIEVMDSPGMGSALPSAKHLHVQRNIVGAITRELSNADLDEVSRELLQWMDRTLYQLDGLAGGWPLAASLPN